MCKNYVENVLSFGLTAYDFAQVVSFSFNWYNYIRSLDLILFYNICVCLFLVCLIFIEIRQRTPQNVRCLATDSVNYNSFY